MEIHYDGYVIQFTDEPNYSPHSTDNKRHYQDILCADDSDGYYSSAYGISVWQAGECIAEKLLLGSGGATGIHTYSAIADKNGVHICCGDSVFSLSLPQLDCQWITKADLATCFQIYPYQDDYIVHGELFITRLNPQGKRQWQYGGRDIFVTLDARYPDFSMEKDGILLTDFSLNQYKISYDGNTLWEQENTNNKI